MAFVSYQQIRSKGWSKRHLYTITDSDFGVVEISFDDGDLEIAVVMEYEKRNLPVGKNLALLTIYMTKSIECSIEHCRNCQDAYCGKHIKNWDVYAKERDQALEKLLVLV